MEDSGFGELSHSNTKWYARYKLKDALDHDTRHVPTEDATRTPVKAVPNNRYFDGRDCAQMFGVVSGTTHAPPTHTGIVSSTSTTCGLGIVENFGSKVVGVAWRT